MGIGVSVFLLAVGAILRFAVSASTEGIDLQTVGTILIVVGVIGLLMSIFFWSAWTDRRRGAAPRQSAR
jgi:heme/copper-type cytochrome/quinol oxidase subunit 2